MWLLNTSTYQIVFAEDPSQVRYAILSHVWSSTGEQTFQHIQTIHTSARSSFPHTCEDTDPRLLSVIRSQLSTKIRSCCDYAHAQGYPNLWIDACCIDKTSSAELSEAINSMFTWYSQADVCYVFLPDVPANENPAEKLSSFRRSIWFKRGWTLQELIVPSRTVFLSKDWRMIGTMAGLANVIEDVTGIDADILLHRRQLHTVSVAQRMSWAAGRETTRIEDEAYCLMGIFGVRLAVIYGEGAQAFVRLQEEIMKRIPDQSLFLWGIQPGVRCFPPPPATLWPLLKNVSMDNLRASKSAYLFASCPMDFFHSKGFTPIPLGTFSSMLGLPDASRPPLHTPSGYGIYTTLPVITLSIPAEEGKGDTKFQAAILACQDLHGRLPALLLSAEFSSGQHLIGGFEFHTRIPPAPQRNLRRYSLSEAGINASSESDDSSDDGGTLCQWASKAAISPVAVRYSRSYPRVVLLEPSLLKDAVSDSSLAILPLCVPHQRMPAVSEFAVLRRPPNPKSSSFAGLCMMIIPRWTLGHLSALGYSTSGSIKDGEIVSIPMSMRVRRGAMPRWYHNFTLNHATHGTISVAVSTCPFISRAPLHASVGWTPGREQPAREPAELVLAESCADEHVDGWTDSSMRFDGPPDAPAVTLSFSIWDDCADGLLIGPGFEFTWDCYALDIRVERPHRFPTADSPESRTPQTSRDTCQRNTSGLPEALVPARQDVSAAEAAEQRTSATWYQLRRIRW